MLPFLKNIGEKAHTLINYSLISLIFILIIVNFFFNKQKVKQHYLIILFIAFVFSIECFVSVSSINIRYLKMFTVDTFFFISPLLCFLFLEKRHYKLMYRIIIALIIFDNLFLFLFGFLIKLSIFYRSSSAYAIAYMDVLVINLLLYYLLKKRMDFSISSKIMYVLIIVFLFSCLITAGFMIALLTCIISLIITFGLAFFRKRKNVLLYFSILLFSLLALIFLGYYFLPSLAKSFYRINIMYYERFMDIYSFIYYGKIGNVIAARLQIYAVSINSFLKYPLFGVAWHINDLTLDYSSISLHSSFLDHMAYFGLLFFALWFFMIMFPPLLDSNLKFKTNTLCIPMILSVLIILSVDNLCTTLGPILFMIFYLIDDRIKDIKYCKLVYSVSI